MKTRLPALAVLLCALTAPSALLAAAQAQAAQAHTAHDHAAPQAATPAPATIQRWATDAPLRKGMAEIRRAVDALRHFEHNHMGPDQALTLATRVEDQVGYLVANCKLEPQADAALHAIIARLLQGAAALKANPRDTAAIATMRQALQDYPRQFDDSSWAVDEPEEH